MPNRPEPLPVSHETLSSGFDPGGLAPRFPYRWRIVALLFFLAVINYLDRQTLSVLSATLRRELGFTPVEYSYLEPVPQGSRLIASWVKAGNSVRR